MFSLPAAPGHALDQKPCMHACLLALPFLLKGAATIRDAQAGASAIDGVEMSKAKDVKKVVLAYSG
ncbi:hypothetical protein EN906_17980, partial [Mesorhizobium sp. M7A.F.Ca.CA.004.06.1.1]|uniref:hypothetical protein n=1 Tax=Mesorhizobium sp. M7A.F.Ca.CA.004.06.1.1 TaxID=2496686 RepID=UPI000FD52BD5